jgi:hypothetical protein
LGDRDHDVAVLVLGAEGHRPGGRGELHGVVEDVGQGALQQRLRAGHRQGAIRRSQLEREALVLEQTPLHASLGVAGQDLGLIRRLIERGADVNAQANRGDTPLSWAIARGNLEVAGLLIEPGARLDSYSHPDGSLVHKALQLGQPEMARLLVERGATVDRADPYGFRELHWAAIRGHADLIGLLAEHGAEVDRVDSRNRTPLHYAARHGHRGAAEALVGLGADLSGIEEENYGPARQLRRRLNEGEAFLWYLGGHAGDAWAVKTRDHLLLFDPDGFDPGPEAGLANGRLSPREVAGLDLRVFVSKPPHDCFRLDVLRPPSGRRRTSSASSRRPAIRQWIHAPCFASSPARS